MNNQEQFRFIGLAIPIELAGLAEWRATQYYGADCDAQMRQAFVSGYLQGRKEGNE